MAPASNVWRNVLIALLWARASPFSVHHQRSPSLHQLRLRPFGTTFGTTHRTSTSITQVFAGSFGSLEDDEEDDDEEEERVEAGFGTLEEDDEDDEEEREWLSDMELVRRAAQTTGGEALTNRNKDTLQKFGAAGGLEVAQLADPNDGSNVRDEDYELLRDEDMEEENSSILQQESIYDEDELELIHSMGGFQPIDPTDGNDDFTNADRETGYLGDSTLMDISHDYTVPICYIADVLTTWGTEPPIDVNAKLGDLVTGEQAFSLLEGLTTLDIDVLNRNYSDDDLMEVCDEYEISIRDAFTFCKTEKYNLPFGVRTFLRVDQEETLVRMLAPNLYGGVSDATLDGEYDEDDPDGLTMEDIARMQPMED